MQRLWAWVATKTNGRILVGIGVVLLVGYMIYELNKDPKNEATGPLTEEEEERYQELEARRKKLAEEGKVLPAQEYEEWLALDQRKHPIKAGKDEKVDKYNRNYEGVEIVDETGKPIGEFDAIDTENQAFIEDKSAEGLKKIDPKTGLPYQTPEEWATKQILNKTNVRIANLEKAAKTRPTKAGSSDVPDLDEIKDYRKLHFVIDNDDPKLQKAVNETIDKLKAQHPDWDFSVEFGK